MAGRPVWGQPFDARLTIGLFMLLRSQAEDESWLDSDRGTGLRARAAETPDAKLAREVVVNPYL